MPGVRGWLDGSKIGTDQLEKGMDFNYSLCEI